MFDHVSIGVSDIERAGKFYDAVLKPLDVTRLSDGETSLGYGEKSPALWVQTANRPVKADMEFGPALLLHGARAAPQSTPSTPLR